MDTISAFARGAANQGKESMVFDWDKAARIIRDNGIKSTVSAGLSGDWEWTGGEIFAGGKPVDKDDTYTAETFWPDSALAILNGESE